MQSLPKNQKRILYVNWSAQKYNKYKHQFPRMRQSELINKILKQWQNMTEAEKLQLWQNPFMQIDKDLAVDQQKSESSTEQKRKNSKKTKNPKKIDEPKFLKKDPTRPFEIQEDKNLQILQSSSQSAEIVVFNPDLNSKPIKYLANQGRRMLQENHTVFKKLKQYVSQQKNRTLIYASYRCILLFNQDKYDLSLINHTDLINRAIDDPIQKSDKRYRQIYAILKGTSLYNQFLKKTSSTAKRRIFRDDFVCNYFGQKISKSQILLKIFNLDIDEMEQLINEEKRKWEVYWKALHRQATRMKKNRKAFLSKKAKRKEIMKQNRK